MPKGKRISASLKAQIVLEARISDGEKFVTLKSGGDVTFVTDQKVEPLPPNYILGKIEKPTGQA